MKIRYLKPITETISVDVNKYILINHSEPEITSNIGSNENNVFEDEDNNMKVNLWDE